MATTESLVPSSTELRFNRPGVARDVLFVHCKPIPNLFICPEYMAKWCGVRGVALWSIFQKCGVRTGRVWHQGARQSSGHILKYLW